ncbi:MULTISPECIES: hypothetical protein [Micromonospora]|uniref:hypothetical protein n=1 Tax=Micromonospora TaxID=1873 RepID=UPI00083CA8DD|nr:MULTISPECIES: hypothetical protein [Micromonospora]MBQ1066441.1 hypothetical protein [Micromonospora sp. D75]ODB78361.1 hypothetical protein A8711_27025 [Micromonospora sp. II]RQX50454.1 hypothetical protein DLJ57_10940 [Micromonospora chalcea]
MKWLRWPGLLAPASVLVLALIGALLWLTWPDEKELPPRERRYEAFTACLLTDDEGLAGTEAKAAWAGMQAVSTAQLIKVQYLAVDGPQTTANALAYFNTMALEGCGVVVAVGQAPVAAVEEGKGRFPEIRYVTVGAERPIHGVYAVSAGNAEEIRAGVESAVARSRAK